jgi:hypothetical protein
MKKSILPFISVVVMIVVSFATASAQPFEGTIEFKRVTDTDTSNYIYYVKSAQVRIDEIGGKSHKPEGSYLIDMDNKSIYALNHDRKLYMEQPTPPAPTIKGTFAVKKGQTPKNLQGYKCWEYTITNPEENTQITYWLADGKFSFFEKLLRQLNRKDKSSVYFLQLPDIKNTFPMLSVQQSLDGKEQVKLEVTKITKKEVDPAMFELPKGYSKFEK